MPIFNATSKDVHTKVHGNWHYIKAGQIKNFQEDTERFMVLERGYLGLVSVPEEFNDGEYRASEEGRNLLIQYKQEGVSKRVQHLQWLRHNEMSSLKMDLEKANLKMDPLILANAKIEEQLEELHSYQIKQSDEDRLRVERIRELDKKIQGTSSEKGE